MRKISSFFSFIATIALVACSSPTINSTTGDEDDVLSSGSNAKSSSSAQNDKDSSSSVLEDGEKCIGEPGTPWDGTTAKDFACGSGTKLNPYIIKTAEQLAHLSFVIGAKDKDYLEKYYKLGADIILNDGEIINEKGGLAADSTKLHKWTPIGNSSVAFAGNFDGDGHTVSGLFINTTSRHNGLFGSLSGMIKNLILENSWISGGSYTAAIAGACSGLIENVENKSVVVSDSDYVAGIAGLVKGEYSKSNARIRNCSNYGSIKGGSDVGGISGSAYSAAFESVKNYGFIEGRNEVGGISGRGGYSYVSNYPMECKYAMNTAKVYGKKFVGGIFGIAGYSSPSISGNGIITVLSNASNKGLIEGESYVAGIIGSANRTKISKVGNLADIIGSDYAAGVLASVVSSTTESLYNLGSVSGTKYVGGIIGYNDAGITSSAYSSGKVDGDSLVGLMIGYNYNTTMADYYYLKQGDQEPFGLNNGGGVATPKTEKEMKSQEFAELLGEDFVYDSEMNDGYPVLGWEKD